MFTGIVKQIGTVASNRGKKLVIRAGLGKLARGTSLAVNGVCLTLVGHSGSTWEFDVSPETLSLTSLGNLKMGDKVNLELPLKASDWVSGHFVSGHVDACAKILRRKLLPNGFLILRVALPSALRKLVAYKGSIAVDGVSLTVTAKGRSYFETVLIPETLRASTLGLRAAGQRVNLEVDVLARYVGSILSRT